MTLSKAVAMAAIASLVAAPAYAATSNSAAKLSLAQPSDSIPPPPAKSHSKVDATTVGLVIGGVAIVVGGALLLGKGGSHRASM